MDDSLYLFIDETGVENPINQQSDQYILCGCSVPEWTRNEMRIKADQIKFKYWGRTNIVFHSIDMARNQKDFAIFQGKTTLKDEFLSDLTNFLSKLALNILVVVVDKISVRKKNWDRIKVVNETAKALFGNFILITTHKKGLQGKIVIEASSTEKDRYYLHTLNEYFSNGLIKYSIPAKSVRESVTSISFVNKQNHDIEEQIADLFAYAAKCKYLKSFNSKLVLDKYETKILSILERKLFQMPLNLGVKKAVLKKVNSFEIIK